MNPITSDTAFQFTYWINSPSADNGWSETWFLLEIDEAKAYATALKLLQARAWVLTKYIYIELAELKCLKQPYKCIYFPQDQIYPLPQWDEHHDDSGGIYFRFDADGSYIKKIVRGLENAEIHENKVLREWAEIVMKPIAAPADPTLASKSDLLQYWLWTYYKETGHIKRVGGLWQLRPWDFLSVRKYPCRLPYGQSVKRVSAEWADWHHAPDFSYCGTVCGVQRTCRSVLSNPYVSGPHMALRFYFSKPTARVFPEWTIFWGTYRDKKIPTGVVPGEIKGVQHTFMHPEGTWEYSFGFSYGDAPGIAPTGTANDFLGLGIKPWIDAEDLDEHLGAGCDMPVFSFTVADEDPNTIIVSSCLRLDFHNSDFLVEQVAPGWAKVTSKNTVPSNLKPRLADWYADNLYVDGGGGFTLQAFTRIGDVITANADGELNLPEKHATSGSLSEPSVGDRILLDTGDTDAGVYVVTDVGSGSAPFVLTRASDFRTNGIVSRTIVAVASGINYTQSRWLLTTADPITINTTALSFELNALPSYATRVKDRLNDEYWPALSDLGGDLTAGVMGGLAFKGTAGYTPAVDSTLPTLNLARIYVQPTADNLTVTLAPGVEGQLLFVQNTKNFTLWVNCITWQLGVPLWTKIPVKWGQVVQFLNQSPGLNLDLTGPAPGVGVHGWYLLDSFDHVNGPPSLADVQAMIQSAI